MHAATADPLGALASCTAEEVNDRAGEKEEKG